MKISKTLVGVNIIMLGSAYLCLDCEAIQEDPKACQACGGKAVHPIKKFLNRQKEVRFHRKGAQE